MFSALFTAIGSRISLPVGFFLVLLGIALVIILPNLSEIESKLGFTTKAQLQQQVVQDAANLNTVTASNANLKKDADNQQAIGSAKVDAVIQNNNAKQSNQTVVTNIIQKKNSMIKNIKAQFKKNPQSAPNQPDLVDSVAKVQIDSIWETYCQFNVDNACPNMAKAHS